MRKLFKRIRLWLIKKLINRDEWWNRRLPEYNPYLSTLQRNDKGNIDKNTSYWQMVANVADQPAFMNEIHDLEKKYIDAIEQSLMMEDTYKHIAGFQSTLYGIREVRKIITDGINKTRGDHA